MAVDAAPSDANKWIELAAGVGAIVLSVALVAAVPQLRHCVSLVVHGHFAGLRTYVRSLGAGGLVLLLGLMLLHAVIWYPSEIVSTTVGYVYGFASGLPLAAGGWLLAALLSYALGRSVGRPLLQRLLGRRFAWLTATMDRGGISLLLAGRLLPIVPFALLGYAAGATRVRIWRFSWTSVVGYLPLTAAVVYLGSQAQTLSTSSPVLWLAVAFIITLLIGERVFHRRHGRDVG
jgi:uncharacterized membrane protein YdjX (TVP38/TMEM64 family)